MATGRWFGESVSQWEVGRWSFFNKTGFFLQSEKINKSKNLEI